MTLHAGWLSQPMPSCTHSAAQLVCPTLHLGRARQGPVLSAAQRLGPSERCRGKRWHSFVRPLGEQLGARPGHWCFPAVPAKARKSSYLQTLRCHTAGCLQISPASLQESVWQMGQLRSCWVLGGCHSRGCSWPCKVLCPKFGFQGHHGTMEGHTGTARQGCLQEAGTEPRPAEPGHLQEQHSSPCCM